jgi:hypothetical protein
MYMRIYRRKDRSAAISLLWVKNMNGARSLCNFVFPSFQREERFRERTKGEEHERLLRAAQPFTKVLSHHSCERSSSRSMLMHLHGWRRFRWLWVSNGSQVLGGGGGGGNTGSSIVVGARDIRSKRRSGALVLALALLQVSVPVVVFVLCFVLRCNAFHSVQPWRGLQGSEMSPLPSVVVAPCCPSGCTAEDSINCCCCGWSCGCCK